VYAGFFLYLGAVSLRMFTEVFVVAMLPEAPSFAISSMMLLLIVTGVLGGLEVLGRLADLVAPVMVLSVVVLAVMGSTLVRADRLLPLFEFGVGPMLRQTLTPVAVFGEAALTVMLAMPYLREPRTALKAMWVGALVNAAVVSLGAAMLITMMGPHLIDREFLPTLTAIRMIRLAEFLTRIEWLLAVLWMGSMYLKIGLLLWGSARSVRESVGLRRRTPVIALLGGVMLLGSRYVVTNTTQLMEHLLPERSLTVTLPVILLFPLLTMAVALLRGLRENHPAGGSADG
jgi:spore germination protein KB